MPFLSTSCDSICSVRKKIAGRTHPSSFRQWCKVGKESPNQGTDLSDFSREVGAIEEVRRGKANVIQLYYSEGSRDVADDYLHIWPLLPSYLWELDYSRASECPFPFPVFLVYLLSAFLLISSGIGRSRHLHCHYTVVPALIAVTHSRHPSA